MKEERRKEIWKEYRKDLKDLGKRVVERRNERTERGKKVKEKER
jgi:hypothetical protein